MTRQTIRFLWPLSILFAWTAPALPQGKVGETAPEFPLGLFTDGGRHQLSDYRGKVVVLFFYEAGCPKCKGTIPERNEIVKAYDGKPVKFIAVGASDILPATQNYSRETRLAMTIFADNLGIMESRYGQKISLQNIYQFRVIGPDGKIVGNDMSKATIDKALANAKFKYDPKDYDPKLKPAIDAFEWNQWDAGFKLLTPLRRSIAKPVAESANKLYDEVKKEAEGWKSEAEKLAETEPVKAYDLYTKITTHFAADPIAKTVFEPKRKLATSKAVLAELAARKAYDQLNATAVQLGPDQKKLVAQQLQGLAKKHSGTPTAERATTLATELDK